VSLTLESWRYKVNRVKERDTKISGALSDSFCDAEASVKFRSESLRV